MRQIILVVTTLLFTTNLWSQAPEEESPIKLQAIRVLKAPVASGGPEWTKILVDFQSSIPWIDGTQISITALVGDGTPERPYAILSGSARYINIPQGNNTGVLFISPNTTKRYGGVTAVEANIYFNDRVVSTITWSGKSGETAPENWKAIYDRKDGALLPITAINSKE
jgi:hypothetical protein